MHIPAIQVYPSERKRRHRQNYDQRRVDGFAQHGETPKHADWVLFEDSNHPRAASDQNIHSL